MQLPGVPVHPPFCVDAILNLKPIRYVRFRRFGEWCRACYDRVFRYSHRGESTTPSVPIVQRPRTWPFQGQNTGSNPVGDANLRTTPLISGSTVPFPEKS